MSKQIWRYETIYVAPGMLGKYERLGQGSPVVVDERNNNEKLDPRKVDDKICIYEREVKEWFLNRALELVRSDRSSSSSNGFIVLMI